MIERQGASCCATLVSRWRPFLSTNHFVPSARVRNTIPSQPKLVPSLISAGVLRHFVTQKMSLSSKLRKERLSLQIARDGIEMAPCTACRKARVPASEDRPKCIVSSRSGQCSECARKGYKNCDVTVSRLE